MWFWYVGAWTYMWSIIAGNFLLWILWRNRTSIIQKAFIVILTAYIAGAAESYSVIYLFLLCIMLLMKMKNLFPAFTQKLNSHSLIFALLCLVLFYSITILAPGTWARKDMLTDATFVQHLIVVAKAYGIIVLFQTPKLIHYLLFFGLPWLLLGQELSSGDKMEVRKTLLLFIKSVLTIGIFILILIFPASWVLYDLPPARALSQISLLLSMYVSFIFFYAGYKVHLRQSITYFVVMFSLIIGIIIISYHITQSIFI